ncbi:MAG: slipin family protein [Syntrophomonadaceae bacterium]|nr:slipin family protein [Syntrophomonadaceae bacterium]
MTARGPRSNGLAILLFLMLAGVAAYTYFIWNSLWLAVLLGVLAVIAGWSLRVAKQWERVVVLRLGKYHRLAGPGIFFIIPVIDEVPIWIDLRIRTTFFAAEKTLTRDNVPVNVDAVMFWVVNEPIKAALEVEEYQKAIFWAAQTTLRDVIGKTELSAMLTGREQLDEELKQMIDHRTESWGVSVTSVEIRDVMIPTELQDAMSREAQADRERRARVILAMAEVEIADKFTEAAKSYRKNPEAFSLRAMNILYEGIKQKTALVIVPSNMVDSLNPGGILGYVQRMKEADKWAESKDEEDLMVQPQD